MVILLFEYYFGPNTNETERETVTTYASSVALLISFYRYLCFRSVAIINITG